MTRVVAGLATAIVAPALLWLPITWSGPGRFSGGDFLGGGG